MEKKLFFHTDSAIVEAQKVKYKVVIEAGFSCILTIRKWGGGEVKGVLIRAWAFSRGNTVYRFLKPQYIRVIK